MARRLPKSERSPSPPPGDQRDAAIQELSKGSELATQLMAQLELIPERELDRRDDALANVRRLSMSLSSSLSALRSEREHYYLASSSSSGAGPVAVTSVSGGGGGGGSRTRKTRRRGSSETVFITTTPENDGFHWRKYGEKNILNSEFRRLYYRCGYSDERNCQAKKYVQQENNKQPPEFRVTLTNEHTCNCNALFPDQASSSSTSQVLDFTKASVSSPLMDSHVGAPIFKEEEEEVPSIDESTRSIMSTIMRNNNDYDELSPRSWNGGCQ
uniref:WRKY domain-containing protein n=1 Tax=Oryza punctata TaxID=4537 RepID=A0A0E0L3U5_ORYPU